MLARCFFVDTLQQMYHKQVYLSRFWTDLHQIWLQIDIFHTRVTSAKVTLLVITRPSIKIFSSNLCILIDIGHTRDIVAQNPTFDKIQGGRSRRLEFGFLAIHVSRPPY